MEEWKTCRLAEICDLIPGFAFKSGDFGDFPIKAIKIGDIQPPYVNRATMAGVNTEAYNKTKLEKFVVRRGDFVLAMTGATIGKLGLYIEDTPAYLNQRVLLFRPHSDVNERYVYYALLSPVFQKYVINHIDSETAQPNISGKSVSGFEISLPSRAEQDRIASILSTIDDKIELNNRINHNLEEQAQALYKSWFIDFEPFKVGGFVNSELGMIPKGWCVIKAKDFCPINIGKTPPRKESQWFSSNRDDITWVSISDMAECGVFLDSSSETLTHDAIRSFNITIVPEGSVLLSFKLTIGRVAIAGKKLTTNEAIARFITDDSERTQYLYLTLKNYDYSKLGSTSSIATAVNSKIIRAMPLIYPGEKVICDFAQVVSSLFGEIRKRQIENKLLTEIRDTILPRLMSDRLKAVVSDC